MIKLSREILNKAIELNGMNECVLMCYSGVDTIAGVHYLLSKLNKTDRHRYKVFHFNHKIRPQNDKMEESFYNFMHTELPDFYKTVVTRNPYDDKATETTEAKLREFRIKKLMEHIHLNVIVTFHHLNDCVESYLLNCIRGHDSYQPIPFWTEMRDGTTNVSCHPFLFTKKQNFIDYCVKHDLMKYVIEDETNASSKGSRRNMIRNEIMPVLDRDKVGLSTIVAKKMKQRLMIELLK
jgi:tRNA(Ile)-lysidine synthetase-like protein